VINQLFTFSSTIERLRQGPLSEHLDAYATSVAAQGYGYHSIRQQIVVIADLSRWLKQKISMSRIWTALPWIDSCGFDADNNESAEAIRKRCSDC
jgi:hypothetical protein